MKLWGVCVLVLAPWCFPLCCQAPCPGPGTTAALSFGPHWKTTREGSAVCIFREIGPDVQAGQLGHSSRKPLTQLDLISPLPSGFFLPLIFFPCHDTLPKLHHRFQDRLTLERERESERAPARVCPSAFCLGHLSVQHSFWISISLFLAIQTDTNETFDQDQANLTRS